MSRRGNGEGSIFERNDGRWVATVDFGYRNGKRDRKSIYGATRKEVADQLKRVLRAQQLGMPADLDASRSRSGSRGGLKPKSHQRKNSRPTQPTKITPAFISFRLSAKDHWQNWSPKRFASSCRARHRRVCRPSRSAILEHTTCSIECCHA